MVNGRACSGGRTGHTRRGTMLLLLWLSGAALAGWSQAGASLIHTPIYPHLKLAVIDYRKQNTEDELEFMADHYDLIVAGRDEGLEGRGDRVQVTYTNYYCIYVGSAEYEDAKAWAAREGVDFEAFFIHYAEETEAEFRDETHVVPAGSRVPTYAWYGTDGDLTKDGARVVMNPGNPHYRAWKLDYADQRMSDEYDGLMIDNTSFNRIVKIPKALRGGTIAEYPVDPGTSYGNDLLTLFAEFKERFGETKGQMPNIGTYLDDPRMYPYIWGIFRESLNYPDTRQHFDSWQADIDASAAAGVKANFIGGGSREERYDIPLLASFYMLQNDTCYFFPFLQHLGGYWGLDPRVNQWLPAAEYDIGKPVTNRYTLQVGIDPSSPVRDTMTATVTQSGSSYLLTDQTKTWEPEQWQNLWVVFPSEYALKAYHSGDNWISLWAPKEVPTAGTYHLGKYTYTVFAREYENALVLMRPRGDGSEVGDASAAQVPLPVTGDNPSGAYYVLDRDGGLGAGPLTSISLRGADGAILVKESKAGGTASLHVTADKAQVVSGGLITYTISWRNTMDMAASGAVIHDAIPAGTSYVAGSAEATGGYIDGAEVRWDLGDLPAGASGTVSFQVRVD